MRTVAFSRNAWRKAAGVFLFVVLTAGVLSAQQITRVAVVDLARVLANFPKETAALKNFELKKAEVQAEADRRSAEIRNLQTRKNDAANSGDIESTRTLELELARKVSALQEYVQARQNELDLMARALSSATSFLQKLNSTIARVAEEEGYSLVLNLKPQDQNANLILWNSPSIDITDKVIQALSR